MRPLFSCYPRGDRNIGFVLWYPDNYRYSRFHHTDKRGNASLAFCQVHTPQGLWRVERLGPFTSNGGFDWWQLGWRNALQLEDFALSSILAHWTGPILLDGTPLPNPPIHQHHAHLIPCARKMYCQDGTRVVEHHGDWQFPHLSGALSMGQHYGGGSKVVESMSLAAELNDVRCRGSIEMIWFYEIALLIRTKHTGNAVLSLHRIHGPGQSCMSQFCQVMPFPVPASEDTFTIHGGWMPYGGTMVVAVFHAHQAAFHSALLMRGSSRLLSNTIIASIPPFQTTLTASTSLASNTKLRVYLLACLRDYVVCHATHASETIEGKRYDRASVPSCVSWIFDAGAVFTAITMNGPTQFPVLSPYVREHAIWFITYIADDNQSHWTQTFCREYKGSLLRSSVCSAPISIARVPGPLKNAEHEVNLLLGIATVLLVTGLQRSLSRSAHFIQLGNLI